MTIILAIFIFKYNSWLEQYQVAQVDITEAIPKFKLQKIELTDESIEQTGGNFVEATRVPGTSMENCHQTQNGTQTCNCSGYTYEHDNDRANCPGHSGRCQVLNVKNMVKKNGRLDCLRRHVNCVYKMENEQTLNCKSSKNCPKPGESIDFPKEIANGQFACPNPHFNTCTLKFKFKDEDRELQLNDISTDCNDKLGDTILYYSKKNDEFHTSQSLYWVKNMIICFLVILILAMYMRASFLSRNPAYCHIENTMDLANRFTTRYENGTRYNRYNNSSFSSSRVI